MPKSDFKPMAWSTGTVPTETMVGCAVSIEQLEKNVRKAKRQLRTARREAEAQKREEKLRRKAEETAIETLESIATNPHPVHDADSIEAARTLLQIAGRLS